MIRGQGQRNPCLPTGSRVLAALRKQMGALAGRFVAHPGAVDLPGDSVRAVQ